MQDVHCMLILTLLCSTLLRKYSASQYSATQYSATQYFVYSTLLHSTLRALCYSKMNPYAVPFKALTSSISPCTCTTLTLEIDKNGNFLYLFMFCLPVCTKLLEPDSRLRSWPTITVYCCLGITLPDFLFHLSVIVPLDSSSSPFLTSIFFRLE